MPALAYNTAMTLDIAVEGVLLYRAAPIKKSEQMKLFEASAEDLAVALQEIASRLESGATRLLETDTEVQLVSAPELDDFVHPPLFRFRFSVDGRVAILTGVLNALRDVEALGLQHESHVELE